MSGDAYAPPCSCWFRTGGLTTVDPECPIHGEAGDVAVSVGSVAEGYPCPKDGTTLTLIADKTGQRRHLGAWCPLCHTVWKELLETPTCGEGTTGGGSR